MFKKAIVSVISFSVVVDSKVLQIILRVGKFYTKKKKNPANILKEGKRVPNE